MTRNTLSLRGLDIPSINRFGIGFDNMFNELTRITQQNQQNYPPYNIVKQTDDQFYIEIAAAGFKEGELKVELNNRLLTIRGSSMTEENASYEFLYRGISTRDFERTFTLAEHVEIINATNKNGILTIYLERQVPEEKKPKVVDIKYIN